MIRLDPSFYPQETRGRRGPVPRCVDCRAFLPVKARRAICAACVLRRLRAVGFTVERDELGFARLRFTEPAPTHSVGEVVRVAAEVWGVSEYSILAKDRSQGVMEARFAVYDALYRQHDYSSPKVGKLLGRDHTTILYGIRRLAAWTAVYPAIAAKLLGFRARL